MPIEDDYRRRLHALLEETDAMLDIPLTPAWRDGLAHLKQTLEYIEPRLGGAHPRPFLLEQCDGAWQLTRPDGNWYKRYRDLSDAVADAAQNDWLYVYVDEHDRYALSRLHDEPETTAEMCHWITETINGEDAPVRPTDTGDVKVVRRAGLFHLTMDGHASVVGFNAEHTLKQLRRFERVVHMDANIERELGDAFPYVEPDARDWLRENRRKLRLAAIQEHFNQRVSDGIGWQSR